MGSARTVIVATGGGRNEFQRPLAVAGLPRGERAGPGLVALADLLAHWTAGKAYAVDWVACFSSLGSLTDPWVCSCSLEGVWLWRELAGFASSDDARSLLRDTLGRKLRGMMRGKDAAASAVAEHAALCARVGGRWDGSGAAPPAAPAALEGACEQEGWILDHAHRRDVHTRVTAALQRLVVEVGRRCLAAGAARVAGPAPNTIRPPPLAAVLAPVLPGAWHGLTGRDHAPGPRRFALAVSRSGSALYGTAVATSDEDYALVYLDPTALACSVDGARRRRAALSLHEDALPDKSGVVEFQAAEAASFVRTLQNRSVRDLELLYACAADPDRLVCRDADLAPPFLAVVAERDAIAAAYAREFAGAYISMAASAARRFRNTLDAAPLDAARLSKRLYTFALAIEMGGHFVDARRVIAFPFPEPVRARLLRYRRLRDVPAIVSECAEVEASLCCLKERVRGVRSAVDDRDRIASKLAVVISQLRAAAARRELAAAGRGW